MTVLASCSSAALLGPASTSQQQQQQHFHLEIIKLNSLNVIVVIKLKQKYNSQINLAPETSEVFLRADGWESSEHRTGPLGLHNDSKHPRDDKNSFQVHTCTAHVCVETLPDTHVFTLMDMQVQMCTPLHVTPGGRCCSISFPQLLSEALTL